MTKRPENTALLPPYLRETPDGKLTLNVDFTEAAPCLTGEQFCRLNPEGLTLLSQWQQVSQHDRLLSGGAVESAIPEVLGPQLVQEAA